MKRLQTACDKSAVRNITEDTFLDVITDNKLVALCFSSSSNLLCREFDKVFEMAAANHSDILFARVDGDSEPSLAKEFKLDSVPTVMLFREGVVLFSQPGTLSFAEIEDLLEKANRFDMTEVRSEIRKQYE